LLEIFVEHLIQCRCGNLLNFDDEEGEKIVFCKDCYMNYVIELKNGEFKIKKFYYFPDD